MQKVVMWYLRPGREFQRSIATKTALSLRDTSHKTSHSLDGDPIGIMPPTERFESLREFFESPPPPISGTDYTQHAVFEEAKFWCVPKEEPVHVGGGDDPYDIDHGLPIAKKHQSAIAFYGLARRINAIAPAQKHPTGNDDPYRHPANWAAAGLILLAGIAIAIMGIQLGMGGGL